jgi:hypothetical protein
LYFDPLVVIHIQNAATDGTERSSVAIVALVVHICAGTRLAAFNALEVFTVVALDSLLATNVSDLLTEEAICVSAMSSIIRGPQLKITRGSSWIISALTLLHVEAAKVHVSQECLRALSVAFLLGGVSR